MILLTSTNTRPCGTRTGNANNKKMQYSLPKTRDLRVEGSSDILFAISFPLKFTLTEVYQLL